MWLSFRPGSSVVRSGVCLTCLAILTSGCDDVRRSFTVPDVTVRVMDSTCDTATVRWGDGSSDDVERLVSLPWSADLGKASGLILVVAGRRECDDDGTVTVEIDLDDELEDRGTASGPFAVASAAASFF